MWRQLREDLGLRCHLSKDTPPQLLTGSGLTMRYGGGVVGVEEGDKGPEAENRPASLSVCVGGRAMSRFGFSGSCETRRGD